MPLGVHVSKIRLEIRGDDSPAPELAVLLPFPNLLPDFIADRFQLSWGRREERLHLSHGTPYFPSSFSLHACHRIKFVQKRQKNFEGLPGGIAFPEIYFYLILSRSI
jgi:hypothetical protein